MGSVVHNYRTFCQSCIASVPFNKIKRGGAFSSINYTTFIFGLHLGVGLLSVDLILDCDGINAGEKAVANCLLFLFYL